MSEKQFVFVSGTGRSGTAALGSMLGAHPDICILVEQFSWHNRRGELSPGLFVRGNMKSDEQWERFQASRFVGDKIHGIIDIEGVEALIG